MEGQKLRQETLLERALCYCRICYLRKKQQEKEHYATLEYVSFVKNY